MADAETARRLLGLLDLTELSDGACEDDVERLLVKALGPPGRPAAVCVWPQFVTLAAGRLRGRQVAVATVINFPAGGDDAGRAVQDTDEALSDGAGEIDLVLPYRAFLAGDAAVAADMVEAVKERLPAGIVLKVIIETGAFPDQASIAAAARLAIAAGADFLKTSTGRIATGATQQAATTLLEVIRESVVPVGLKVSGGIRTVEQAAGFLTLAEAMMGEGWAQRSTFRIGASSLHAALVEALGGARQLDDPDGIY